MPIAEKHHHNKQHFERSPITWLILKIQFFERVAYLVQKIFLKQPLEKKKTKRKNIRTGRNHFIE